MLYIGLGSTFNLDGIRCEVVEMYRYGKGTYVKFKRVDFPYAPLFELGVGTLQFYLKVGRLIMSEV